MSNHYSRNEASTYSSHSKKEQRHREESAMERIDKKLKKQLRKQMEIIREGKNKKKHKSKSKKRSIPEPTFSSDSDTAIPTRNYQPRESKHSNDFPKFTQAPAYYPSSPEPISYHPNGSVLLLQNSNLEITTRNSRLAVQVQILTQQSHKTVIEYLFDPGLAQLQINKDMDEAPIIEYLMNPQKRFTFLTCWIQCPQPHGKALLTQVMEESEFQGKILGWENQDIKLHFLTLRQMRKIERLFVPSALVGNGDKVVMIVQYPQTLLQIRHKYQPFQSVSIKEPDNTKHQQQSKRPDYTHIPVVYEGWEAPKSEVTETQPEQEQGPQSEPEPAQTKPPLPQKIQEIKDYFGISFMQQILSDEEDEPEKPKRDLATELLNAIKQMRAPSPSPPSEKDYQQQFQNYHYNPQMYQVNNNWQVSDQVYNPFNPIPGKFAFAINYDQSHRFNQQKGRKEYPQSYQHLNYSYSINASYMGGYQQ